MEWKGREGKGREGKRRREERRGEERKEEKRREGKRREEKGSEEKICPDPLNEMFSGCLMVRRLNNTFRINTIGRRDQQ